MRTSRHILRTETGRYGQQRLERFARRCQVCGSGDVEDEFQFVFKCEAYTDIRHVYISSYYYRRPSVIQLISLLNSSTTSALNKHAIFYLKNHTSKGIRYLTDCYIV